MQQGNFCHRPVCSRRRQRCVCVCVCARTRSAVLAQKLCQVKDIMRLSCTRSGQLQLQLMRLNNECKTTYSRHAPCNQPQTCLRLSPSLSLSISLSPWADNNVQSGAVARSLFRGPSVAQLEACNWRPSGSKNALRFIECQMSHFFVFFFFLFSDTLHTPWMDEQSVALYLM